MKALELELTRIVLWYGALSLIAYLASMYVLYVVIRAAIRDGINDSRLVGNWQRTAAVATRETTPLPEMRAER